MGIFTNADVLNITIGPNVQYKGGSMANAFLNCTNFNSPVSIPNGVTNLYGTFSKCRYFNQPVAIPNTVVTMAQTFMGCNNFNQPIEIPNGVTSMSAFIQSSAAFNQPLNIPASVTTVFGAFHTLNNFNAPVTIAEGTVKLNATQFFCNSRNYNQPISFPSRVNVLVNAFYNCKNMSQNICIYATYANIVGMLGNKNNSKRVNIFIPANAWNIGIGWSTNGLRNTYANGSVVNKAISWTNDTANNCFYNAVYNVYVYYTL